MAAITPSASELVSLGSRDGVGASFTTIADTNTWTTGLSVVEGVVITPAASGYTYGATYAAGGVVTFLVAGGPMSNVRCLAIGYK
jgi:hypothetical protein